ncbi:MAG TPA: beta-propeller fold lactonase family protein [Bryobacteraceae bacterium]|nr:beta-propeller fold lactonase family protein [Bryobacteraceae bacterium]
MSLPPQHPFLRQRRRFCVGLAVLAASPKISWPQSAGTKTVLYAATGAQLSLYQIGDQEFTLAKDSTVTLPAPVQYAWPHPSKKFLYAAYSNRSGSNRGDINGVGAFGVDRKSGRLQPVGRPAEWNNRPIHVTVDAAGDYLLAAFNDPSAVTVHRIDRDGSIGSPVAQTAVIDAGIYAHQIRVAPSNRTALLVTRGNNATRIRPEDPGAIKVFEFSGGQLSREKSVAPGNGYGFGPRHLDFHPTKPWVYLSMERENQLQVFGLRDGSLTEKALFSMSTLRDPGNVQGAQIAGPIHFRRDGKFVYLANRADGTTDFHGKKVFAGGENNIAVYRVDRTTGEPALIQNIDTQAFHARTFSIHPNSTMLVAASVAPMFVRNGEQVTQVPAALSVFRMESDGRLTFQHKYAVDTTPGTLFWCGMLQLG